MDKVKEKKILIAIIHFLDTKITDEAISSVRKGSLIPDIAVVTCENDALHFSGNGITVITDNENRGYAFRLNKASEYAIRNGYDYVIFANNDIIVEKDTIKNLYEFILSNPESVAGPVILGEDRKIQSAGIRINLITGRHINLFFGKDISSLEKDIILPDAVAGTFFMLSVPLLKILRFDEAYDFYFEDVSFCLGATELGSRPVVLKNAVIIHKGFSSISSLEPKKIAEMVTRNHIRTIRKHSVLKNRILKLIPYSLTVGYNLLYFGLRTKNPSEALRGVASGVLRAIRGD